MADSEKTQLVLGLGNLLLSDEGFGVHVARMLLEEKVPGNTAVLDCGTASWYALPEMEKAAKLIVVDSIKGGNKAGTVYHIDVKTSKCNAGDGLTLHDIDFMETLQWLKSSPSETIVLGVEPEKIAYGLELSETVNSKIPTVIKLIQGELKKC